MKKPNQIQDFEYRQLARSLLPAVKKAFEDPEVQKEFEEWEKKCDANKESS